MNGSIFTCNSCATEFKTGDLQRFHMKTEWHRYNLKRRMAQLPAVTSDEFAEKLQISKQEQENEVDEFGFAVSKKSGQHNHHHRHARHHHHHNTDEESVMSESDIETLPDYKLDELELKKIISQTESVGSELSHLTFESEDNNHIDLSEDTVSEYSFTSESNFGSDYPTEEGETDYEDIKDGETGDKNLSHTTCLFCGLDNKEVERNVRHMFRSHGLYIPERSYLVDLPGLLDYLINTIVIDYACLCCNYVGNSLKGIRDHMDSKRHCRMPYETAYEKDIFAPFYDYSSLAEKPHKAKTTKTIHFQDEADSIPRPNTQRIASPAPRRRLPERTAITDQDRRMISGVTEKQYKSGLKKAQQLEKRAQDDYLRKNAKRMNFQMHYRDELLQ
ncbi:cytoplasmic 60S subunit biogenesis factor Reh1p [Monosporozyma unispora]|nr:hypothetical protein C6P44_004208 [Kazachstania unispora]